MTEPRVPHLKSVRLTEENKGDVVNFNCGNSPWEVSLNDWIIGRDGRRDRSMSMGTEVRLYYVEDELAGFGSFGPNKLRWPYPDGKSMPVAIIPAVAVLPAFRSAGGVPRHLRVSWRILSDLVARSLDLNTDLLTLYVHQHNVAARQFYLNFGFGTIEACHVHEHHLMWFALRPYRLPV